MLVTIIIPTYNTPIGYLEEAIHSIINQTFHKLELIVVDDGSTQFLTDEYFEHLKNVDARIKVLKNERKKGVAGALNTGLKYAKGKYIFRMDSDDISLPKRLEKQVAFMEKHPEIDILGCYAKCFGNSNAKLKAPCKNMQIKTSLLFGATFTHPTICFRKTSVQSFGVCYNEDVQNEDYDLWTRLSINPKLTFAVLRKSLLNYRVHNQQITKQKQALLKEQGISVRVRYLGLLCQTIDRSIAHHFACLSLCIKNDCSNFDDVQKKVFFAIKSNPIFSSNQRDFKRLFWKKCCIKTLVYSLRCKKNLYFLALKDFFRSIF